MILELADRLEICSRLLTKAAERDGKKAREIARLRMAARQVAETLEKYPASFPTLEMASKLREAL